MPTWSTLRIDAGDGSLATEYRIEDGSVEIRIPAADTWQRLTPEDLTSLVMRDTVVAHWLEVRMGLYPLIRACSPDWYGADQTIAA